MQRIVEPELLDSLPPNDPRAIRSRRDLRRVNAWMGNSVHLARAVEALPPPRRIIELGAGDGTLMLKIARRFAHHWQPGVELILLDMAPVVAPTTLAAYQELGWKATPLRMNLRDWILQAPRENVDLIVANLFLHHFSEEELRVFFAAFAKTTGAFLSCDPRRWGPALFATELLWFIACNDVTRHDARTSVRAGFRDRELTALWPRQSGFALHEYPAGYAAHLFLAEKSRAR
jgi:hypothetical protein